MLPEMNTTDPYSPTARANASANPVSQAGNRYGRMTRDHDVEAARAEARRGLLDLGVEIFDDRLQRPDDERQADEDERDRDAERRESDLDPVSVERPAQPAVRRVERRQRDAGHRRRQRERQVDQRVDDAPCRESRSAPAPTPRAKPNTALTQRRDQRCTELSRYDATTRGSVIVFQNACPTDDVAVLSGSVDSGIRTIRPRYRIVNPIVSRNPGSTRRRPALRLKCASYRRAPGLVDLVEGAAVGEVRLLRRLPAAERLVDGEELHARELALVLGRDLRHRAAGSDASRRSPAPRANRDTAGTPRRPRASPSCRRSCRRPRPAARRGC